MCGYFYVGFIDFMLKDKSFLVLLKVEGKVYLLLTNMKRMIK